MGIPDAEKSYQVDQAQAHLLSEKTHLHSTVTPEEVKSRTLMLGASSKYMASLCQSHSNLKNEAKSQGSGSVVLPPASQKQGPEFNSWLKKKEKEEEAKQNDSFGTITGVLDKNNFFLRLVDL